MKYSKRITLSKATVSSLQALAAVAVSLGSMWASAKMGIVIDEATKGSLLIIVSTILIGVSEGIRNWYKHRD